MTIEEFKLKLEQALAEIKANDVPLRLASYGALAEISKRVFTDGLNSDGGAIGQYNSTDPIYINPKKAFGGSKLGTPRGKNGDTKFKDGRSHVSVYLDSYKDYKSILGKPSGGGFVNLELSGDLKSDFENNMAPRQINTHEYIIGLKRPINIDKRKGLEAKYGRIFFMTQKEIDEFIADVKFEFAKIFGNIA